MLGSLSMSYIGATNDEVVPGDWRGTYCGRQNIGVRTVAINPIMQEGYRIFDQHKWNPQVLQMKMEVRECLSGQHCG